MVSAESLRIWTLARKSVIWPSHSRRVMGSCHGITSTCARGIVLVMVGVMMMMVMHAAALAYTCQRREKEK
jgi:hypothetical protein